MTTHPVSVVDDHQVTKTKATEHFKYSRQRDVLQTKHPPQVRIILRLIQRI